MSSREKLLKDIRTETDLLAELYKKRATNPKDLSKQFTRLIEEKKKRILKMTRQLGGTA